MSIESKLKELGFELPQPLKAPPGVVLPFSWVRVSGDRAIVSGHVPINTDGSLMHPLGKIGAEVTAEQGRAAAEATGLAILASLQRELGDFDRITAWLRVFGMVNAAPKFNDYPSIINGFSDLILSVFGTDRGSHARSAVGMAGLPFGVPVEIEAEVEIRDFR